LLLARVPPIPAENKSGNTGAVEILMEQLPEPSLPYRGVGFVGEQFGRLLPQLVHKADGVRRIYRRCSRQRWRGDQDEEAGQKGTAYHVRGISQIAARSYRRSGR